MRTTGYVCLFAALSLTPLHAETITGTVFDASGAIIPGAAVTITNADSKASQFVVTGPDGSFNVPGLAPGKYRVDVEARGFRLHREYASLNAGQTVNFSPVLQIGRITEKLTVKATGTPAYQSPTQRLRVGGNVEPAKVLRAPRIPYPESAIAKGAVGSVVLRAVVLLDGTLANPVIVRSPDDDLSAAALEGVKQWRYVPTKLNGQPVETETMFEVVFELVP